MSSEASTPQDYYTGDLEKRFNYFWRSDPPTDNPWLEFVRLVDANPSTPAIRTHFRSANIGFGRSTMMSRNAYYRWLRSLRAKRRSEVT